MVCSPAALNQVVLDLKPLHRQQFVGLVCGAGAAEGADGLTSFGVANGNGGSFGDNGVDGKLDLKAVDQISPDGASLLESSKPEHAPDLCVRSEEFADAFKIASIKCIHIGANDSLFW